MFHCVEQITLVSGHLISNTMQHLPTILDDVASVWRGLTIKKISMFCFVLFIFQRLVQRFVDVVLIWILHMVFVDMITVLHSLVQLVKCAGKRV